MTKQELLARLQTMAEPDYAQFSGALIPGGPPLLGVRLPKLRTLAKELAKDLTNTLPALDGPKTLEEQLLLGMTIGYAKLPDEERRVLLERRFLPVLDNWSACDSTAVTCKFMAKRPEVWLPWLQQLSRRNEEFPARFGIVCLLLHHTATPQGRRATLDACAAAPCNAPYTRLGIAWAVSVAAVKEPELGLAFLQNDTLDAATHNKAIQKICESYRATPEYRTAVRALRRGK